MTSHAALQRAHHLTAIERWDEAREAVGPALADEDTAYDAHCVVALCHLGTRRFVEAQEEAERAIGLEPGREWGHRLQAISWLRRGRPKKALAGAQAAVARSPHQAEPLNVLAIAQSAAGKKTDAAATAAAILAQHPGTALAHETAGEVASRAGDHVTAERHYREALRLDPQDDAVSRRLGDALKAQGRRPEAAQAYLASAAVDPTSAATRSSLGRLGLPVFGGGAFLTLKIVGYLAARGLLHLGLLAAYAGVAVVFVGGVGVVTALRVRGTAGLPAHLRAGLRRDHRDAALEWVWWFGLVSVGFAVAAMLAGTGGTFTDAAVTAGALTVVAVACFVAARLLRSGPAPERFPTVRGWGRSVSRRLTRR